MRRPSPEDEVAELHEWLADPWRVKIVDVLCERGELTHGQLMKHLGLTQPRTSQVLGYLRSRGFVYGDRRGRYVYYGLSYPTLCDSLRALHREWLARRREPPTEEQQA
jgi:ArsR family transcriptional regulator